MRIFLFSVLSICATTLRAEPPQVVTDILPVQSIVARIIGDGALPGVLIGGDTSAHDFSLRPSDIEKLKAADLVVWTGPAMTPWMPRARGAAGGQAKDLVLSEIEGVTIQKTADGQVDPHLWLDPENAKIWATEIAAQLAQMDPAGADQYTTNAADLVAEVDDIAQIAREKFADFEASFITLHAGFGYFEARFGVEAAGTLTGVDHHHISPGSLKAVRQIVQDDGVNCLIAEPTADPHIIETVFEGAQANVVTLDPLGVSLEAGATLYTELLRNVGDGIASCAD